MELTIVLLLIILFLFVIRINIDYIDSENYLIIYWTWKGKRHEKIIFL